MGYQMKQSRGLFKEKYMLEKKHQDILANIAGQVKRLENELLNATRTSRVLHDFMIAVKVRNSELQDTQLQNEITQCFTELSVIH